MRIMIVNENPHAHTDYVKRNKNDQQTKTKKMQI